MYFDRPLVEFELDETNRMQFHQLEEASKYFPFEMQHVQNAHTLLSFFEERVTPPMREGLLEELEELGFNSYSTAAVLIASNGRDCQDFYWVRFKEGPQTWNEVWEAVGVKDYMADYRKTLQGADLP